MKVFVARQRIALLLAVITVSISLEIFAADHYVAPGGTAAGNGTINKPWDLASALQRSSEVKAGDTIWLRGGTYGNGGALTYACTLSGTQGSPVVIRQYRGERATVNAGIRVSGSYVWLWGFEITNTNPQREVRDIDKDRPRGIVIAAASNGVKIINMAIHDVGRAGVGGGGNNLEIYGTLLWGNGIYERLTRGDATYLNLWHEKPQPGVTNRLRDNVAFRNFYSGYKIYSEWPDVFIDGFELEGNVGFDNGPRNTDRGQSNLLVRSERRGPPIKRLRVIENFSYRVPGSMNPFNAEFGCKPGSGTTCEDAEIRGNYFVGAATGLGVLRLTDWNRLTVTENTVVGTSDATLATSIGTKNSASHWGSNSYYGGSPQPFKRAEPGISALLDSIPARKHSQPANSIGFREWKSELGETGSSLDKQLPRGLKVFVRENVYEPGERANIIIYNWDKSSSVNVDLSRSGLADGTAFEIIDAQNYFGAPIAKGVFHSASPSVSIPMSITQVAPLVGNVEHLTNQHTAPEFAVFILRATAKSNAQDQPRNKILKR